MDIEEIDRHLAAYSQSDVVTESGAADAAGRREDLLSNSGLLLPRDGGRAAFYHQSFQEFLAAVRLRRIGDKPEDLLPRHAATPAWRRTLRFLFCAIADKDSPEAAIAGFESLRDHLEPARLQRDPNPALLFAACLEVAHGRRWNLERFTEPLRRACDYALEHLDPRSARNCGGRWGGWASIAGRVSGSGTASRTSAGWRCRPGRSCSGTRSKENPPGLPHRSLPCHQCPLPGIHR